LGRGSARPAAAAFDADVLQPVGLAAARELHPAVALADGAARQAGLYTEDPGSGPLRLVVIDARSKRLVLAFARRLAGFGLRPAGGELVRCSEHAVAATLIIAH